MRWGKQNETKQKTENWSCHTTSTVVYTQYINYVSVRPPSVTGLKFGPCELRHHFGHRLRKS